MQVVLRAAHGLGRAGPLLRADARDFAAGGLALQDTALARVPVAAHDLRDDIDGLRQRPGLCFRRRVGDQLEDFQRQGVVGTGQLNVGRPPMEAGSGSVRADRRIRCLRSRLRLARKGPGLPDASAGTLDGAAVVVADPQAGSVKGIGCAARRRALAAVCPSLAGVDRREHRTVPGKLPGPAVALDRRNTTRCHRHKRLAIHADQLGRPQFSPFARAGAALQLTDIEPRPQRLAGRAVGRRSDNLVVPVGRGMTGQRCLAGGGPLIAVTAARAVIGLPRPLFGPERAGSGGIACRTGASGLRCGVGSALASVDVFAVGAVIGPTPTPAALGYVEPLDRPGLRALEAHILERAGRRRSGRVQRRAGGVIPVSALDLEHRVGRRARLGDRILAAERRRPLPAPAGRVLRLAPVALLEQAADPARVRPHADRLAVFREAGLQIAGVDRVARLAGPVRPVGPAVPGDRQPVHVAGLASLAADRARRLAGRERLELRRAFGAVPARALDMARDGAFLERPG